MLKNKFGMATRVLLVVLSVLMAVSLAACKKGDTIDPDQMNSAIQSAIDAANKAQAEKDAALASSIAADKAAQEAKDAANAASIAADKLANDEALKKAEEAAAAAKKAADEAAKKAAEQEAALKKAQDEAAAAKKAADEAAKKAADEAAKAAEKAAAEAAAKAAEEAAAAAKVQEELLKKAQEEAAAAKAAADAAAAQAAADKAALEAALEKALAEAEAAAKAASEAIAKAEAAASKADETTAVPETTVAPETTVVPETTKDPAIAALEEALKQALAEAEAAKKAASEALAKAEEAASKADETTVVPETTVAPETTTQAPETTTKAPETTQAPVMEDKSDVIAAYSKLKSEYLITNAHLYNTDEIIELNTYFEKASADLYNAMTVEAATSIYNTLSVDVAGVRNVKIAAKPVADLVNDLGDVETEVYTVQATKIKEAQDAYKALKKEYANYFAVAKTDKITTDDAVATKLLGIKVEELNRANTKVQVLNAYIEDALVADMKVLYENDTWADGKFSRFDAEDVVANSPAVVNVIHDAHYKYLVLSIVNDGNFGKGHPIDWEYELDEEGEIVKDKNGVKQYNYDKPIAWFTAEELLEVFILPTLDAEFAAYIGDNRTGFLANVEDGFEALVDLDLNAGVDADKKLAFLDEVKADLDVDDIYDELADKLEALSFVDDYKGNDSYADAIADVHTTAVKAYIEAMNAYLDVAKDLAIKAKEDATDDDIKDQEQLIADAETAMENASEVTIARLEANIAKYEAKIDDLEAKEASFIANVDAAALLTFEEMLNADLNKAGAYKDQWVDITDFAQGTDAIKDFLHLVLKTTIFTNFADEVTDTPDDPMEVQLEVLRTNVVKDLEELIMLVSPYQDEYRKDSTTDGSLYTELQKTYGKYDVDSEGKTLEGEVKNTQFFLDVIAALDAAIESIEAVSADDYLPKNASVSYTKDGALKPYYFKNASTYNYAVTTMKYDPANLASIKKVMADTDLWTKDATDYKIEFVITPAEQAYEQVAKLYVAAFEAFSKTIAAEANTQDKYATKAKNMIYYDKDNVTPAWADISAAGDVLKTEMENVKNSYTTQIDNLVKDYKQNFKDDAPVLTVNQIYKLVEFNKDATALYSYSTTANYSAGYKFDGFNDTMKEKVADFYKKVYNYTVVADDWTNGFVDVENDRFADNADVEENIVLRLWAKKLAAVDTINENIDDYKNVPNTNPDTGVTTVTMNSKYSYGVAGAGAQPDYAKTYEDKLATLAQETIDIIMGIKIEHNSNITVSNPAGGKFCENVKINYDLDKAQTVIDAYIDELFGTEGTYAHANNATKNDDNCYAQGNSKIFKAYNTIVLGNSYGISYTTGVAAGTACTHN